MVETAMVTRQSVTAMVGAFSQAETEIRNAYDLLETARERLRVAFTDAYFETNTRDCTEVGKKAADQIMATNHRRAWRALVDRMGVRKVMSQGRRKTIDAQLEKGELPPLTEDNIFAMVEDTAGQVRSFMDEAVVEVYDWLHPRSEHKTNSAFEVGRRVVRTWAVERRYRDGFTCAHRGRDNFVSLDNVFHLLDGVGIPKGHYGPLVTAIEATDNSGVGETDYFSFRCFKNGNLHITFKRLDLLARFNAIAGERYSIKGNMRGKG